MNMIHKPCKKAPNAFGLCDTTGNVWEWVWDYKGGLKITEANLDSLGSIKDPRGFEPTIEASQYHDRFRIVRGCAFDSDLKTCLDHNRRTTVKMRQFTINPYNKKSGGIGFRLVKNTP